MSDVADRVGFSSMVVDSFVLCDGDVRDADEAVVAGIELLPAVRGKLETDEDGCAGRWRCRFKG